MNKKLYSLLIALLITMLAISPAYAGGVSGRIGIGSITFTGQAYGFSRDAVRITLFATGTPVATCTKDGVSVPGLNPYHVDAQVSADYDLTADENGKFSIFLEANANTQSLTPLQLGCPGNDWTFTVDFVYWNYVKLTVTEISSGKVLWQKDSSCTTTRNPDAISCPAFKK
jgi:hypothetical protein